ncbi:MAG TPA: YggS family pyridoxal phosphate-dependent enzyme [Chitinophagales bacterium]|jgi:pyridoxal phosphate enzyme (YggS family)|nr:YggS family pyridoxal phosphate-dependent enzyme [Chitinophagales bacterium]HQO90234.1 YggS family pyridoxal phosphate-dependent enzyme [Chitinophagales bacterium]
MANISVLQDITKLAKEKNAVLVAISKTKPVEEIREVYDAGQRAFGENKVQELVQKYEELPKDIEWHMVGNLQTNKVKYIAPFIHLIHSVDSLKLAIEINKQAAKNGRVIDVLLEIHIAAETNKSGFSEEELIDHLDIKAFDSLKNIRIVGLMGMATNTKSQVLIKNEFSGLKSFFDEIRETYFKQNPGFRILSMGMSGDYLIALEEGSNMIRVGSAIFGEREIKKNPTIPI